jgi:hypothetical protein
MRPTAAIPLHDPDGLLFPHLQTIKPILKKIFTYIFVSLPQETQDQQPLLAAWIKSDPFFRVLPVQAQMMIGDHFYQLYTFASREAPEDQLIHLCYPDRLAFALSTPFKTQFIEDIKNCNGNEMPVLFMRSDKAWSTHPANYQAIENMATLAGEMVFHKTLDFGWCHLVASAGRLKTALKSVHNRDLSMVAEMLIALENQVVTKEVEWLALRRERENSLEEVHKRLNYVIPILKLIDKAAQNTH